MIKQQILTIAFSIILLPANFCCAFWLFREALNLTGMTFGEFVKKVNSQMLHITTKRHRKRRVQRLLAKFFAENSSDPQKSIKLTRDFGFCTLPGLAALCLATYSATNVNHVKYAFIGNIILTVINIALVVWGKIYRKNNPFDGLMTERFSEEKKHNTKNIAVFSSVGILIFGVLMFFMLGIAGIFRSNQGQKTYQSAISTQASLITILNEKGYETANISTTYWEFDENKLEHIAAGVKDNGKFEFYGYSDVETVESVYNQIVSNIAPNFEISERKNHETSLTGKGKMFTAVIDGVYYLVTYQNDTVIYAYSQDNLYEINEILTAIGYLRNR